MSPLAKKVIQYTAIFGIGIAFLYFVFNGIEWSKMSAIFSSVNYNWIALGLAFSLLSHWIRAYRATMLYSTMDYKVSVTNSLYAVLIGYFMNYFIPRGGEISRCAALYKTDQIPVEKSLGTVIVERLLDIVMTGLIFALVIAIQFDVIFNYIEKNISSGSGTGGSLKYTLLGSVVLLVALFFLLRKKLIGLPVYQKIISLLEGFLQGFRSVKEVKSPVLFIALSIAIWICYILMMYVCLFGLEATKHLDLAQCLTVFALGTIGVVIPAPGAGAGTYHFAIMQGLLLFGVAKDDGIAYATVVHGTQMIMFFIVGGISSLIVLFKTRNNNAVQPVSK